VFIVNYEKLMDRKKKALEVIERLHTFHKNENLGMLFIIEKIDRRYKNQDRNIYEYGIMINTFN